MSDQDISKLRICELVYSIDPPPINSLDPESFAYKTFTVRIPEMISKLISQIEEMVRKDRTDQDLKQVLDRLCKLRNHLNSNKLVQPLTDDYIDTDECNQLLKIQKCLDIFKDENEDINWLNGPWLFNECFYYRKIYECFRLSKNYRDFDYFNYNKDKLIQSATEYVKSLFDYVKISLQNINKNPKQSESTKFKILKCLYMYSLWGNKFDLSLSAGHHIDHGEFSVNDKYLDEMAEKYLLCDQSTSSIEHLKELRSIDSSKKIRFDVILDNSGAEVFSDIILIYFILESGLVDRVHVHTKNIPWFVSDVTNENFKQVIEYFKECDLIELYEKLKIWIDDGVLKYSNHYRWTLCSPFWHSIPESSDLYNDLKNSNLLLFKGDLNHRKLISDLEWPHDTSLKHALKGFLPAPILALRTLKSNSLAGLDYAGVKKTLKLPYSWIYSGDYGIIQFVK